MAGRFKRQQKGQNSWNGVNKEGMIGKWRDGCVCVCVRACACVHLWGSDQVGPCAA